MLDQNPVVHVAKRSYAILVQTDIVAGHRVTQQAIGGEGATENPDAIATWIASTPIAGNDVTLGSIIYPVAICANPVPSPGANRDAILVIRHLVRARDVGTDVVPRNNH